MEKANDNHGVDDLIFIWLDKAIESSKKNQEIKALMRLIVKGHLQTFLDPDQCIDYISELATQKVFLVTSNALGQGVIPVIHDMLQIQTIYIFCSNRQNAEVWTKSYSKVADIFTTKQSLLHKLCDDVRGCDTHTQLPMSVFHLQEQQYTMQNLTEESATFMWYRSILMVLRLMAKYCNSKTEMLIECRANYHNDEPENRKINDFEQNYSPAKAFEWYTYDSFVYRLLNKALRTQNFEIIFKFRFFINDLHNQIEQLYKQYLKRLGSSITNHRLRVYRGQCMSSNELDLFKRNVNELISMNSFLSVTLIQQIAEIFADAGDQSNEPSPLQSVLFIIDICDMTEETTPFAFIENYSHCPPEEEVLFTIGAIFKIETVEQHDKMWYVHLRLSKQQNKLCQELSRHMIKQIGSEPGPLSFGWYLYRMSEFDTAERYAEFMLTQFPPNDREIGNTYNLLGLIYKDNNSLQKSIDAYKKALAIFSGCSSPGSPAIITTHYNLGLTYLAVGDSQSAEEHLKQAEVKLFNSSQQINPLLTVMVDSLKGKIQAANGDYRSACEIFEIVIECKRSRLPAEHPSIASTLNELGVVQEKMGHYKKALEKFKEAMKICRNSLTKNHFDLANCHANIGRIYYKQKEYSMALQHFEAALDILLDFSRDETDTVLLLRACIAEVEEKLK